VEFNRRAVPHPVHAHVEVREVLLLRKAHARRRGSGLQQPADALALDLRTRPQVWPFKVWPFKVWPCGRWLAPQHSEQHGLASPPSHVSGQTVLVGFASQRSTRQVTERAARSLRWLAASGPHRGRVVCVSRAVEQLHDGDAQEGRKLVRDLWRGVGNPHRHAHA
jgi:hypothetical protein